MEIKNITCLKTHLQRCKEVTIQRRLGYKHHVFIGNVDQSGFDYYHYEFSLKPCLRLCPPGFITKTRFDYCSYEKSKKLQKIFNFENGKTVVIVERDDYPQSVDDEEKCINRAESRLGEMMYSMKFNNCDSYVNWIFSGDNTSNQYEKAPLYKKIFANAGDGMTFIGLPFLFVKSVWELLCNIFTQHNRVKPNTYISENVKKNSPNATCLCDIKKERNGNLFPTNSTTTLQKLYYLKKDGYIFVKDPNQLQTNEKVYFVRVATRKTQRNNLTSDETLDHILLIINGSSVEGIDNNIVLMMNLIKLNGVLFRDMEDQSEKRIRKTSYNGNRTCLFFTQEIKKRFLSDIWKSCSSISLSETILLSTNSKTWDCLSLTDSVDNFHENENLYLPIVQVGAISLANVGYSAYRIYKSHTTENRPVTLFSELILRDALVSAFLSSSYILHNQLETHVYHWYSPCNQVNREPMDHCFNRTVSSTNGRFFDQDRHFQRKTFLGRHSVHQISRSPEPCYRKQIDTCITSKIMGDVIECFVTVALAGFLYTLICSCFKIVKGVSHFKKLFYLLLMILFVLLINIMS